MADKSAYLLDDFSSDFDVSGKWWRSDIGQGIVSSGQLQLIPTIDYDYVSSTEDWDLSNSHVAWKLVQNANEGLGSIGTSLTVGPDWSNNFEFEISGGGAGAEISCQELVDDVTDTTIFSYDPAVHVWFRIRSSNTTIFWETSPDGSAWTTQKIVETTPVPLSECAVRMSGYFWDEETDPGESIVDDVNLYAGVPSRPKAHTLVDDFITERDQWLYEDAENGENRVINGQLHMLSNDDDYTPLYARGTWDLTDSYFGIQLIDPGPEGNGTFINDISVGPDLDNQVYIRFSAYSNWIQLAERVDGVSSNQPFGIQLDPDRHKYIRIRESDGTVYWETSIDGEYWTERWSKETALDLTESRVRIYCAPYDTEDPANVIWDNCNTFGEGTFGPDVPFKAELMQKTFTVEDGSWWGSEGVVLEDGALHIDVTPEYQYASLGGLWDLRESYASWQMVQNALQGTSGWDGSGTTGTNLIVTVGDSEDDNSVRFIIYGGDNGRVECETRLGGVRTDIEFVYNKNQDKYFRIRESGGFTYWETSANSLAWIIRKQENTGLDYQSCSFGFSVGYWDDENEFGPNGTVILDNFNVIDETLEGAIAWGRHDLSFGAKETGTVQPRTFFEQADWLWNPIPDDPVLDPLSTEIANSALHDPTIFPPPDHGCSFIAYGNTLIHPHLVKPDTPRYYIYMDVVDKYIPWSDEPRNTPPLYNHPFGEYGTTLPGVPIPYGTKIPPGSDCHLSVMDPVNGKEFSLWQARYDEELDIWRCTYGGYSDYHGTGLVISGSATATNFARYACQVTIAELEAGEIPHALFVVSNACTECFLPEPDEDGNEWDWDAIRYPAQKSDGHNPAGVPYPVPQGARLQLDPSIDLDSLGLSQAALAVGKCWQKYGAYVGDSGGRDYPPTVSGASISELWQGQDYPAFPFLPHTEPYYPGYDLWDQEYPDLGDVPTPPPYAAMGLKWDYFAFRKIPWAGNIRVLKNWDGGNEITDPRLYSPLSPLYLGPGITP